MKFEPVSYFEQIARNLKEVSHTDEKKKYFVVPGTQHFFQFYGNNEFLNSLKNLLKDDVVLVLRDDHSGQVGGANDDTTLRTRRSHLFIMKNLIQNDFAKERAWMQRAEELLNQIFAKLKIDDDNGLFDCSSVKLVGSNFVEVHKIADTWHGLGLSFMFTNNYSLDYDPNEWQTV